MNFRVLEKSSVSRKSPGNLFLQKVTNLVMLCGKLDTSVCHNSPSLFMCSDRLIL